MPIYDYVCSTCGQSTEVIHGIEAPAPRFCPACGAEGTLRKAFAAPTVVFKGSGWAKKDRSSAASSSSTAKPGSDAASGSTTGADAPKAADSGSATATSTSASGTSGSSGATGSSGSGKAAGPDKAATRGGD